MPLKLNSQPLPGKSWALFLSPRSAVLFMVLPALLTLSALEASAQEWKGRGRAQGKVVDTRGEPVGGATVQLLYRGQEENGPDSFKTKKNGRWAYMGLSTAKFLVRVEAEGYVETEGEIEVNEYATDKPVEITLRTLEEGPEAPPAGSEGAQLSARVDEANQLMIQQKYGEARAVFEEVLGQLEAP
ncbi:MAG: carboxypeptidase-like regulatory domain-containing protein, partial [Acidobacteriota bacterium]